MKIQRYTPNVASSQKVIPWEQCVAKTYLLGGKRQMGISVRQHSVSAVYVGMCLVRKMTWSERRFIPKDFAFYIAVHDTGKISPGFQHGTIQGQDLTGCGLCDDHSEVTQSALVGLLPLWPEVWTGMPHVSGAHHGRYHEGHYPSARSEMYGGDSWQMEREKFVQHMVQLFGPPTTKKMTPLAEQLLLSLISTADHIASSEEYFDPSVVMTDDEIRERAQEVVDFMGWDGYKFKKGLDFAGVFPLTPVPNRTQMTIGKLLNKHAARGTIFIVEDATGRGKTETALWATYNLMSSSLGKWWKGLYFALPTRLTSNLLYKRVDRFLANVCERGKPLRLIHGQASGMASAVSVNSWFRSNRRALLEPFGIGTVDQVLKSVMRVRYQYMRMAGIFRKVLTFDEVQSYDAYTGSLVCRLVKEAQKMGCMMVILSATLTREAKARLLGVNVSKLSRRGGFPKITVKRGGTLAEYGCGDVDQKMVDVRYVERSPLLVDMAVEHARNKANVLWVENTVGEDVVTYEAVKRKAGISIELGILHSRFLPPRRNDIEEDWMARMGPYAVNRPQGCIFAATQVVEQSVDVDFDILFTSLCPSDFLIQRLGRIWRFARMANKRPSWLKRPVVYIIGSDPRGIHSEKAAREMLGLTSRVYEPYVLLRTAKIWSRMGSVELPRQTRSILEGTYAHPRSMAKWMTKMWNNMDERRLNMERSALDAISAHLPTRNDDEDDEGLAPDCREGPPPTRKEEVPTRQVVLCRNVGFVPRPGGSALRMTLYDGGVVDLPNVGKNGLSLGELKMRRSISDKIEQSMLKIIDPHVFDTDDPTMVPLGNYVFGRAVAVVVGKDGRMWQYSGHTTKHRYTDECGCVRWE